MRVKIIEVEYRLFRHNKQTILRDGEIDIQLIPAKGDVIHLDDKRYRVEQRDFVNCEEWIEIIDWLNTHHFDYRGLIEKGLAIDATGLNIY